MRGFLTGVLLFGMAWMGVLPAQESEGEGSDGQVVVTEEEAFFLEPVELPVWTVEELEALERGDLEVGTALFVDSPGEVSYDELFGPLPEIEAPVEPEEEELPPREIEEEFLKAYFGNRPAGYLVDPQGLLSMQELSDRRNFLDYHAGDSEVDLYVYLFDERQEVPEEGEIKAVFQRHFSKGNGLTALVYYFLGAPERSLLVLSPEVSGVVPPGSVKQALVHAREQAQKKSEPASQLESFSTALSIRLYWMERELAEARGEGRLADAEDELTVVEASEQEVQTVEAGERVVLSILAVSVCGVLVFGFFAWRKAEKKRRYLFPEIEVRPLLGAPHAAGVGAMIHFDNPTLPPSVQREQVPDYLRRM